MTPNGTYQAGTASSQTVITNDPTATSTYSVAYRSNDLDIDPTKGSTAVTDIFVAVISSIDTAPSAVNTRVTKASGGGDADGNSANPSISGTLVAFDTVATNLPQHATSTQDVMVCDLSGTSSSFEVVSVATDNTPGNAASYMPSISANGRFVAFESLASNLVPNDTTPNDVFLRDRIFGVTSRESVSSNPNNSQATGLNKLPNLSKYGDYICFDTTSTNLVGGVAQRKKAVTREHRDLVVFATGDGAVTGRGTGVYDIMLRDLTTGSLSNLTNQVFNGTLPVVTANAGSIDPTITANGRYIVFQSSATNLVDTGDANGSLLDVFLVDRLNRANNATNVTRVNLDTSGAQATAQSNFGSASEDGSLVVFQSRSNLTGEADGNAGGADVYVRDLSVPTTILLSLSTNGTPTSGNSDSFSPRIAGSSRVVVFESRATDLVTPATNSLGQIFRCDFSSAPTLTLISQSNLGIQGAARSFWPDVSSSGNIVSFASNDRTLVSGGLVGNSDVYLRNFTTGNTSRASVSTSEAVSGGSSSWAWPGLSSDGSYVVMASQARLLDPPTLDSNGTQDAYVRFTGTPDSTTRVSVADTTGDESTGSADQVCIGTGGAHVVFVSSGSDLAPLFLVDETGANSSVISSSSAGVFVRVANRTVRVDEIP